MEAVTWSFIGEAEGRGILAAGKPLCASPTPFQRPMTDTSGPDLVRRAPTAARRTPRFSKSAKLRERNPKIKATPRAAPEPEAALRWDGAAKAVDVFDAKADALSVLEALGLAADTVQITRNTPDGQPGPVRALQHDLGTELQSP